MEIVIQLAVILVAAGIFTVISKALNQPPILGYIIAGFLVGPHLGIFPQFDAEAVEQWGQIGIIFLLFGLGLEFSFRKLLKVGMSVFLMAGTQCIGMFLVGLVLGDIMNWSTMESIFLGGMLSMSSTSIIIKVFTDMGLKGKSYAGLVFGILVVLDLIAVVLMVLLSTMAVSNKFAGPEMLKAIVQLVCYLVLWFLGGIFVIPSLLKKARRFITDEILLVASIGLCFLMVTLATKAGFSSALGAFVMGSILAETIEGEHIAKLTTPLKDLFGAVFFVSVGMMVDPAVIAEHWLPILIITICAMVGILIFATFGGLIAGQGLDNSIHAGFSLAQLGEFSFILAGLGCSLGVLRDFINPVIIAVSVITTFATPYMIKAGDPVYAWLVKVLPPKILGKLNPPPKAEESKAEHNEWKIVIKKISIRLAIYTILVITILALSKYYLPDLAVKFMPKSSPDAQQWACAFVTFLVLLPFLYGMAVNGTSIKESSARLVKKNPGNKWPLAGIIFLRLFMAAYFTLAAIAIHVNLQWWAAVIVILLALLYFIMARGSVRNLNHFEQHFFENLNSKEEMEKKNAPIATKLKANMAGSKVTTHSETVSADFEFIGQPLRQMPFRHTTGVNIVKIGRGTQEILTPSGDEVIYPGDKLLAIGSKEQLAAFSKVMKDSVVHHEKKDDVFEVEMITLDKASALVGKTIRECKLRSYGCTVVSVVHSGAEITNPSPEYCFTEGDSVWLAGEKSSLDWLK